MIICESIANSPIVAHINRANQLIDKSAADIFDNNILNPHNTAAWSGEVEAKMPINRIFPPMQIDARAIAGPNNGRELDHLTIGVEAGDRPRFIDPGQMHIARSPRPTGDAHRGKCARYQFHTRANAQIAARRERCLIEGAQLLHGLRLGQLQAAGKILIRRHEGGVGLIVIVILPGRAVLARPMMQSKSKFGWCKDDPIGDCFVHKSPFPNAAPCVCVIDPQPQPLR